MKLSQIKELKKLSKEIIKGAETVGSGLADEHIIVGAYKTMDLERLIRVRYILNKIIRDKKDECAKQLGYTKYKEYINNLEKI